MQKSAMILLLTCASWSMLCGQSLPLMPPQPGGFDVLVSGTRQFDSNRRYIQWRTYPSDVRVSGFQTDIRAQLRLKGRTILTAHLPLLHRAQAEISPETYKTSQFSNSSLGIRYLLLSPGLIDQQRFLSIKCAVITPIKAKVTNPSGVATGYDAWALESGVEGGLRGENWHLESSLAFGLRSWHYSSYARAFGRFSLLLPRSVVASATVSYLHSQRDNYNNTPFAQVVAGYYTEHQARLEAGAELSYAFSRFYGIKGNVQRSVYGHEIARQWQAGVGLWVKWN
jgi:hypothetical protein